MWDFLISPLRLRRLPLRIYALQLLRAERRTTRDLIDWNRNTCLVQGSPEKRAQGRKGPRKFPQPGGSAWATCQAWRTKSQVRISEAKVLSPLLSSHRMLNPEVKGSETAAIRWGKRWEHRVEEEPRPMMPCLTTELHLGEGRRLNVNSGSEFWLFHGTGNYNYWVETAFVTSRHFRTVLRLSELRNYKAY